jgi:two-component sensor histidine kinase
MEVSDFNLIAGCPWPDFWKDEGNVAARQAIAAARDGKSTRFEGAANTLLGNAKFWDVQVSPILGDDGKPVAILSVSRDITPLKKAEQQNRLFAQEMTHRAKNTLAMVQAIAMQTLRPGTDVKVARDALLQRIGALSQAHDILTQSSWTTAPIRAVVEGVLSSHGADAQAEVEGPDLDLSSAHSLSLALVSMSWRSTQSSTERYRRTRAA